MDLLYQRYASPLSFLDIAISQNRLYECVSLIADKYAEQMEWDYYLHKVKEDISFEEFKKRIHKNSKSAEKIDFEATVQQSQNILNGFNPNI